MFQALRHFNEVLVNVRKHARGEEVDDDLNDLEVRRDAWEVIIAAAERHNDPGKFTAFIGYEYTSSGPESQNLHRNVIFRGSEHPDLPFSRLDSLNPEDLWDWMDGNRTNGMDAIAIPHNMNGSGGWMFERTKFRSDEAIDAAYADQRMRNEPVVESTQVKGTSDTHPMLSPNDEWADFEIMPLRIASTLLSEPPGSYVRDAYLRGLVMEEAGGFNPYRFGVIGSSDTHNAAGSFEEDNYWSKTGVNDIQPQQRGSVPLDEPGPDGEPYANGSSKYWGASGLAGVWAESNTRESIFDAFRRKETFSTSGPHIKVRFFGGYGLDESLVTAPDNIERAYASGVPMGSDLAPNGDSAPSFFVWAMRDPDSGRCSVCRSSKAGSTTARPPSRCTTSLARTAVLSIQAPIAARTMARASTLRPASRRPERARASLRPCGPIPTSSPTSMPSTTPACWRIRSAVGRPGTRSAQGSSRDLTCIRRFRIAPGPHRSGTHPRSVSEYSF